jgi:hypothetical protein
VDWTQYAPNPSTSWDKPTFAETLSGLFINDKVYVEDGRGRKRGPYRTIMQAERVGLAMKAARPKGGPYKIVGFDEEVGRWYQTGGYL